LLESAEAIHELVNQFCRKLRKKLYSNSARRFEQDQHLIEIVVTKRVDINAGGPTL
jgi:hypothetical protein